MSISKSEALSLLNIDDSKYAKDAYEELLFSWKQKYLSVVPPVKVINAHILKIERLHSAGELFIVFPKVELHSERITFDSLSLLNAFSQYQTHLMQLKLKISAANSGEELIKVLQSLIELQNMINTKVAQYCPKANNSVLNQIKMSSPTDYHAAQRELMEKDISETEIMNYLRAELELGSYPFNSILLNQVLIAQKRIE